MKRKSFQSEIRNGKEKLLSPSDVTSRLGISYATLIRLIKKGEIPHVKIGKQIRIPESYFDDLHSTMITVGEEVSHEC